jgi:putative hemolysin
LQDLTLGKILEARAPKLLRRIPSPIRPLALSLGERVLHLPEFRQFFREHPHGEGPELIDAVFERLDVSHALSLRDRARIPAEGKLIVVANHPLGGLDGLAVLRALLEVRPDVKVLANDLLCTLPGLSEYFLPFDVYGGKPQKERLSAIGEFLARGGAVLIFPSGEVSRFTWRGLHDRRWRTGAVRFAREHGAPVLPIHVRARNSLLFYATAALSRNASMVLLPHELFNKRGRTLMLKVGDPIPASAFTGSTLRPKVTAQLLQRHVLAVGRGTRGLFKTERAIAHPVERRALRGELSRAEVLGRTSDGKQILLCPGRARTVLREIARLRELTFRAVGEGTGARMDLDAYDTHYDHLVLWDERALEIAGAYRLGSCRQILADRGADGLYSASLFKYGPEFSSLLPEGVELGRSFVQQRYWNSRALDLLWQGIGAFLFSRPGVRHLFGCVSISGAYPEPARELLVHFYRTWFGDGGDLVRSANPYVIPKAREADLRALLPGADYRGELKRLKEALKIYGSAIPTLYKQYSELCEPGGVRFLDFGVDPDFGHCVDGFIVVDVDRITPEKKARYIERPAVAAEVAS